MPIIIPEDIPAYSVLKSENIFVMNTHRATVQDIRPLDICILNLMPTKVETETQLLRLLSNSPLQVNITFLNTETYRSRNTAAAHLERFYQKYEDIENRYFDGMIVTGAPVESMPFEEVKYWDELRKIFDFADTHVTSTIYICWGAQAGLYYYYGIPKHPLPEKLFGIFPHRKCGDVRDPLLKGIDDIFYVPHSRHTTVYESDVRNVRDLQILSVSDEAGFSIAKSLDNKKVFVTGHMEYDRFTLKNEYERDLAKGLPIQPPKHYFADREMTQVKMRWSSAANLFYTNWLNYYVYQVTPYKF